MRKKISVVIALIGLLLFIVGLSIKIPNDELTTLSILSDEYSVIEEYVGGDAYNYIIGASIVSGHIAGAEAQKAIFISIGALIFCGGLALFCFTDMKLPVLEKIKNKEPLVEEHNDNSTDENEQ